MKDKVNNRILVVTSVEAERDAVARGIDHHPDIDILISGVGIAAAATCAATALTSSSYGLVISAGIAGGFPGRAEIGSLVLADQIIAADLGAESPDGFLSMEQLGFGSNNIAVDLQVLKKLNTALQRANLTAQIGTIISVSTVTGTESTLKQLSTRIPNALAEAMEGYGVAMAAKYHRVPVLELRAISNLVGPRDRSQWRIEDALHTLEKACSALLEVI